VGKATRGKDSGKNDLAELETFREGRGKNRAKGLKKGSRVNGQEPSTHRRLKAGRGQPRLRNKLLNGLRALPEQRPEQEKERMGNRIMQLSQEKGNKGRCGSQFR